VEMLTATVDNSVSRVRQINVGDLQAITMCYKVFFLPAEPAVGGGREDTQNKSFA
jgi:hypothetical protein